MNKRERNRLRTRAWDRLVQQGRTEEAREAWTRAWSSRRPGIVNRDVDRARLAMLAAIDAGQSLSDAEQVARKELNHRSAVRS